MATDIAPLPSNSDEATRTLRASAGGLTLGLFWSAAALAVLALWLANQTPAAPSAIAIVLGIAAVVCALAGFWQGLTLARTPPEAISERLRGQRSLFGLVLVVASLVFLALAIWIFVAMGLGGLGQGLGLLLFAAMVAMKGFALLGPVEPRARSEQNTSGNQLRFLGLLAIGIVSLFVGLGLLIYWRGIILGSQQDASVAEKAWRAWLCADLLILGLALLVAGVTAIRPVTPTRILVLLAGGVTGLLMFLTGFGLAIAWRDNVLLGGMAAWQGENGWRVWVCAYLAFLGLGILFLSVLAVRGDVRENPGFRRLLYGYSAAVNALIVLALLIVVNIVLYSLFPFTFDWTKGGRMTALSVSTRNLLTGLKEPTTVYVLESERSPVLPDVRTLLANCQAVTDKLKVVYVDPDRDFLTYKELARQFPEIVPASLISRLEGSSEGRGLLVVYGQLSTDPKDKTPHAFIGERQLVEENPSMEGNSTVVFKGEGELMKEINYLREGEKKRKVYFLQGNDELDMTNKQMAQRPDERYPLSVLGSSELVDKLKTAGYEVKGISFNRKLKEDEGKDILFLSETGSDKHKDIPKEGTFAVVVLGASKTMPQEALDALDRYMDGGGRMLVTFDLVTTSDGKSLVNSGLEAFLKKYGVIVTNDFAMRAIDRQGDDPTVALATTPFQSTNAIAKAFGTEVFEQVTVRVLKADPDSTRFKAEPLLIADPKLASKFGPYWSESLVSALFNPVARQVDLIRSGQLESKIALEPLVLAETVMENGTKPRLVVFGDTEFLSNADLKLSRDGFNYYSLFASSLEWMSEHGDFVGPQPKQTSSFSLPKSVPEGRMYWLPVWLMTLFLIIMGVGTWLVRRR